MIKIKAQIVADSVNTQGDRLLSMVVTFPRIILSEVNTHRMFSKSTSSSRAIPHEKTVEAVLNDPFIPIAWQIEHKGMQGSEYKEGSSEIKLCISKWLEARDNAVQSATLLNKNEIVTKQLCNRLLEPFMWTTMLLTGNKESFDNFFNLRCPIYEYSGLLFKSKKSCIEETNTSLPVEDTLTWLQHNKGQAEVHMMALAELMYDAVNESKPKLLNPTDWHIPFGDIIHVDGLQGTEFITSENAKIFVKNYKIESVKVELSIAMAARISYTSPGNNKEISNSELYELYTKILKQNPRHPNPFEHCYKTLTDKEYEEYYKGIIVTNERYGAGSDSHYFDYSNFGWVDNVKGFMSYRHMIENNIPI